MEIRIYTQQTQDISTETFLNVVDKWFKEKKPQSLKA